MNKDDGLTLYEYIYDKNYNHLDIDTVNNKIFKNFNLSPRLLVANLSKLSNPTQFCNRPLTLSLIKVRQGRFYNCIVSYERPILCVHPILEIQDVQFPETTIKFY